MTKTASIAFAQNVRNEAFDSFVNANGFSAVKSQEAQMALFHYDSAVAVLEALCGPEAHCNTVDTELFSTYSDLFKDRCGFRPRHHVTINEVRAYILSCHDSDLNDDHPSFDWDAHYEDMRREEAIRDAEYLAQEEAREADFGFETWQLQAGRMNGVTEREILAY